MLLHHLCKYTRMHFTCPEEPRWTQEPGNLSHSLNQEKVPEIVIKYILISDSTNTWLLIFREGSSSFRFPVEPFFSSVVSRTDDVFASFCLQDISWLVWWNIANVMNFINFFPSLIISRALNFTSAFFNSYKTSYIKCYPCFRKDIFVCQ